MPNPDPESTSILLQILFLIFLTALNAFFSASEMALVSLNHSRVEQRASEGDKRYLNLLQVIDNPTRFLSTVQVGITFLNIVAGASLADSLAAELSPLIGHTAAAQTMGKIIILVLLTFFTIVLGELFPKRVAQAMKERAALRLVRPLQIVGNVLTPFIWLLTISIHGLTKITPINLDDSDSNMTRDEFEYLVQAEDTALDDEERDMLAGIFSLDNLLAREIMVPRTDAFMIDIEDDAHENITAILNEAYSRVPVYEGEKDNIIGVLHTKKLLKDGFINGFENVNIRSMLQEAIFVPETINVDDLIRELRKTHNQMAILLNEYGGVEGLVTLEDMIEEIVGEIEDETDIAEHDFHKIDERMYVVQGKMSLNDFNEEFNTHLESNDIDTIAGYFLSETNIIPEKGQKITCRVDNEFDHFSLTSLEMDGKRLSKLRVEFDEVTEENPTDK